MKQLRLSIPEPCTVGWHTMTPVDESHRHCGACDRVLTDFSKMSDEQLVAFFQKSGKLCGRFATHQLNRTLIPGERKSFLWKAAFLLPAFLLGDKVIAQQAETKPAVVQLQTQTQPSATQKPTAPCDSLIVEGTVTDSVTHEPLPFVVVSIRNADSMLLSCSSDLDGKFRMMLSPAVAGEKLTLEARFVGYTNVHLPVQPGKIQVLMSPQEPVLIEGAIVSYPEPLIHRHRFFYRLFHWRKR